MSPDSKSLSHSARHAAHTAKLAELHDAKTEAVERGSKIVAVAKEKHLLESRAAVEAHEKAQIAAAVAMKHTAANDFAEVVAAFAAAPSRATASAVALRFKALEAESIEQTGHPLDRELAHALAAEHLKSNPESIVKFGLLQAFDSGSPGCLESAMQANRACRMGGTANSPIVQGTLEALEVAIARVVDMGQSVSAATAQARWDAVRFSANREQAELALAAIEKAERAPLVARAEAQAAAHASRFKKGLALLSSLESLAAEAVETAFSRGRD